MNELLIQNYELAESKINFFRTNGHVLLPQLSNKETIKSFRQLISSEVSRLNEENRPMKDRDTYSKAFLQITNLWIHSEEVRKFVLAKRFATVAAQLLGVEKVRIYHDQALYKEPGGGITPWHQDQYYWPIDTANTITMWMPLVDLTEDMGILTFASKTQTHTNISKLEISDQSEKIIGEYVEKNNFSIVCPDKMNAGDASFHYGWTLHNAPGNRSEKMREVMTVIYFADGAKVIEPENDFQKNDLSTWLPGLIPGDYANSELNPVI